MMDLKDCVVGLHLSLRLMSYGVMLACQLRRMMMSLFLANTPVSHALAVSVASIAFCKANLCGVSTRQR